MIYRTPSLFPRVPKPDFAASEAVSNPANFVLKAPTGCEFELVPHGDHRDRFAADIDATQRLRQASERARRVPKLHSKTCCNRHQLKDGCSALRGA
jgi:hypothetical protein